MRHSSNNILRLKKLKQPLNDINQSTFELGGILIERLIKFDKEAKSLINYETLEDQFRTLYKSKLSLFNGNHENLNAKLISIGCKTKLPTNRAKEALPVYIRHSDEHPGKNRPYEYKLTDLKYSVSFLEKIK